MIGRAVVTGGAGFVGSHLVDRLVDEGCETLVVDDLSTGRLDNLAQARRSQRMAFHQIDIRDQNLTEVVSNYRPEVVFHLAAQASVALSVEDPATDASINIVGTVNVLSAALAAGARKMVNITTGGALYGSEAPLPTSERAKQAPDSPYGISKKATLDYLKHFKKDYGLDFVSVAPSNIYGPRQDPHGEAGVVAIFVQQFLDHQTPVIYGDGSITRDYVYVEDVVDALMRGSESGSGRLFNIGTGLETSVLELYRRLASITGFSGEPEFGPDRPGDVPRSCLDAANASKHLGWEPFTALEAGLRLTVEWYKSR
ncbi:MAG: GDP-mannose 4,6-dehydratase [Acidimicrobiia bacterium]|nr:GDP-mannose 4,6-dehydratase [Acidimicrobiia bacterium]